MSSYIRAEDNLRPAQVAVIEMLVCVRSLSKWQLVRNDDAGLGLSDVDQVAQTSVVRLHVALARTHLLTLEPELAKVESNLALLRQIIRCVRILRHKDANDTDLSSRLDGIDEGVHYQIRNFFALRIVALVANALRAAV
jgi:hypothetical protein